jgi:hypothetical protein
MLEVINVKIIQHLFVVEYLSCNMCSIGICDNRNRRILDFSDL